MEKLKRIDWRKTEKTDDLNYLKQVATTLGVKWVGVKKEDIRTACLAERKIGRKKIEHKAIGVRDETACAKLPTKTAQIKFLFDKEYHPAVISVRVSMHITNVYATLRRSGQMNTGKSINASTIASIKATIAAKQKAATETAKGVKASTKTAAKSK